jgi:hypothetical protein
VYRNIIIRPNPSSNLESALIYIIVGVRVIVSKDVLSQDYNNIRYKYLCFNKFIKILEGVYKEYKIGGIRHLVYNVLIFP